MVGEGGDVKISKSRIDQDGTEFALYSQEGNSTHFVAS
jgi:hypothetical protein